MIVTCAVCWGVLWHMHLFDLLKSHHDTTVLFFWNNCDLFFFYMPSVLLDPLQLQTSIQKIHMRALNKDSLHHHHSKIISCLMKLHSPSHGTPALEKTEETDSMASTSGVSHLTSIRWWFIVSLIVCPVSLVLCDGCYLNALANHSDLSSQEINPSILALIRRKSHPMLIRHHWVVAYHQLDHSWHQPSLVSFKLFITPEFLQYVQRSRANFLATIRWSVIATIRLYFQRRWRHRCVIGDAVQRIVSGGNIIDNSVISCLSNESDRRWAIHYNFLSCFSGTTSNGYGGERIGR